MPPQTVTVNFRTLAGGSYSVMKKDHPEAYPAAGQFSIDAKLLRDEITSAGSYRAAAARFGNHLVGRF